MMLLYVCPQCGLWADMSISEAIGRIFAHLGAALRSDIPDLPPLAQQCPDGHGAMVAVSATERIFVRQSEQETPGLCQIEENIVELEEQRKKKSNGRATSHQQKAHDDRTRRTLY